ncbi:ATP-binding cassette sub-family C member 10-like isoform X2 [Acropora muricata]|uniref:ATP-binding cassette sub-family C member 10-like isoform X2 n=1 Tax=Acropora muricata TaxID=159855 RepID=UPI0034E50E9C
MARLQDFCGFKNESSFIWWDRNKEDFGNCFKLLCLVIPANILLFGSSLFFARRKLQIANLLGHSPFILSKLQVFICALIFFEVLVEVTWSLIEDRDSHNSPVYFLSCGIVGLAWLSNAFMAWRNRYITILKRCYPSCHVLVILLVFLMTCIELYSVILKSYFNPLVLHEYGSICRFILEVIFLSLLVPLVCCLSNRNGLSTDFLTAQSTGIQVSGMQVNSEKDAMLKSASRGTFYSSIQCVSNHLGIAEDGANVISRLTFWWVQRMMKKGYKGELQSTADLFLLPQSLSTKKLRITFADSFDFLEQKTVQASPGNRVRDNSCSSDDGYAPIMFRPGMQKSISDPNFITRYQSASVQRHATMSTNSTNCSDNEVSTNRDNKVVVQRTLLSALHHAFGVQYYCIGILKLTGDALSFAGPLLLHALVSFMENRQEPMSHGYYYAGGLFLTTCCSAFINSQFNYWVNKIGLKIRAVVITTVYNKALSVSLTTLSAFSSGEVVNFMSTDTDRVVNFAPSFHQFWSLPFQIAVALYLLHQQVGVSFLAGLSFAVLLVPVNRWLAKKIQKLSQEMMAQKDNRVKMMNEILHGIRVIKFYAWEKNFEAKIKSLRTAELKSLRGRKYLDAWCVYFWATTPVIISILTFTTYALLGNKLTAAKVFTSVALFNMLISPLNAFPWVLNGLMEAWVSLNRIQAFLSLENLDLKGYYQQLEHSDIAEMSSALEIMICNGHFSWKQQEKTGEEEVFSTTGELTNITLPVKKGQFIGVIGKVGSGKSSLLAAITAEMEKRLGEIFVKQLERGFGLAAQEPWIQHGTVKENILFGKAFDVEKYMAVIRACALDEDLQMLPAGDETEIGENGVTLSGGQKARVALARAVYQDKEVYLLDDPLAAVDAHVAAHLFHHCIMGLLQNKTRILCTHHTHFLSAADLVVVMDGGSVTHFGPPEEILQAEQIMSSIVELPDEREAVGDNKGKKLVESKDEETMDEGLVKEEEKEKGVVKLHVYKSYWFAIGSCLATSILLSLLLMQASRNIGDWWLAYWISHSRTENHLNSTMAIPSGLTVDQFGLHIHIVKDTVTFYLVVYGGLAVANTIFTLLRAFLFAYGGLCAAKVLHSRLLKSILSAPVSFFDVTPIGRIINRFSSDMYSIDDSLPFILNIFLAQAFGVAGTVVITCYGLPWFILVLVPLVLMYYYIQNYYRRTSRELKRLMSVTLSPIYAHFSETLSGLTTIRALRDELRFKLENEFRLETNQRANFCALVASQWLGLFLQFIGVAMVTAVAFIAVLEHHFSTVDPGLVGLAISYALSVTDRLSGMVTSFTETEKQMVSVERAVQYIEDVIPEHSPRGSTSRNRSQLE